jgi:hypothetical protein
MGPGRVERRLRQSSGMTPEPTARDETACNSDDATADGIEGNHTGQHERQDDGGSAALPVALGANEHDFRDAEENCDGEEGSAGLREPKPMAEPSPIASQQSHARILGQTNERHPFRQCPRMSPERNNLRDASAACGSASGSDLGVNNAVLRECSGMTPDGYRERL